jgi:hypothetical protein
LAAAKGHRGVLKLLYEHCPDLLFLRNHGQGYTALHFAVMDGHVQAGRYLSKVMHKVASLFSSQPSSIIKQKTKSTKHKEEDEDEDESLVEGTDERLKAQGVNVRAIKDGSTALHFAASRGDSTLVATLLKRGADPRIQTRSSGWSALHYAAACGSPECCTLLVESLAEDRKALQKLLHCVNNKRLRPKQLAQLHGHKDLVPLLSWRTHKHKHKSKRKEKEALGLS